MASTSPPRFSGPYPEKWISAMEQLMFEIPIANEQYVEFSLQHIEGTAKLWIQANEERISDMNWCDLVYNLLWEFDKETGNSFTDEVIADDSGVNLIDLLEEEPISRNCTVGNLETRLISGAHGSKDDYGFWPRDFLATKMQNSRSLLNLVSDETCDCDVGLENVFSLHEIKINMSALLDFMAKIEVPIAWRLSSMNVWSNLFNQFFYTYGESVHSEGLKSVYENAIIKQPGSDVLCDTSFDINWAEVCNSYGELGGYSSKSVLVVSDNLGETSFSLNTLQTANAFATGLVSRKASPAANITYISQVYCISHFDSPSHLPPEIFHVLFIMHLIQGTSISNGNVGFISKHLDVQRYLSNATCFTSGFVQYMSIFKGATKVLKPVREGYKWIPSDLIEDSAHLGHGGPNLFALESLYGSTISNNMRPSLSYFDNHSDSDISQFAAYVKNPWVVHSHFFRLRRWPPLLMCSRGIPEGNVALFFLGTFLVSPARAANDPFVHNITIVLSDEGHNFNGCNEKYEIPHTCLIYLVPKGLIMKHEEFLKSQFSRRVEDGKPTFNFVYHVGNYILHHSFMDMWRHSLIEKQLVWQCPNGLVFRRSNSQDIEIQCPLSTLKGHIIWSDENWAGYCEKGSSIGYLFDPCTNHLCHVVYRVKSPSRPAIFQKSLSACLGSRYYQPSTDVSDFSQLYIKEHFALLYLRRLQLQMILQMLTVCTKLGIIFHEDGARDPYSLIQKYILCVANVMHGSAFVRVTFIEGMDGDKWLNLPVIDEKSASTRVLYYSYHMPTSTGMLECLLTQSTNDRDIIVVRKGNVAARTKNLRFPSNLSSGANSVYFCNGVFRFLLVHLYEKHSSRMVSSHDSSSSHSGTLHILSSSNSEKLVQGVTIKPPSRSTTRTDWNYNPFSYYIVVHSATRDNYNPPQFSQDLLSSLETKTLFLSPFKNGIPSQGTTITNTTIGAFSYLGILCSSLTGEYSHTRGSPNVVEGVIDITLYHSISSLTFIFGFDPGIPWVLNSEVRFCEMKLLKMVGFLLIRLHTFLISMSDSVCFKAGNAMIVTILCSLIHVVFHVSQLKKKVSSSVMPQPLLPPVSSTGLFLIIPVELVDVRVIKRRHHTVKQALLMWSAGDPHDQTWKEFRDFQTSFPAFNLEDKVRLMEEGLSG